jgi:hypothetical protein
VWFSEATETLAKQGGALNRESDQAKLKGLPELESATLSLLPT